jgi:SNF2 family DNA or RNA helicase
MMIFTTSTQAGMILSPAKKTYAHLVGRPSKNANATRNPKTFGDAMEIYNNVLYDYQKDAADRIASQRQVLLADQPGLGKTLMVLGGLEKAGMFELGKNIIIITPIINAQTAWLDTIEKFVAPYHDVNVIDISRGTVHEKRAAIEDNLTGLCNIIVANHNAIDVMDNGLHRVDTLTMEAFDVVVIDESHMVLPIAKPKNLTRFWRGLNKLRTKEDAMRIAVSGTPDRGKLENRYGTWLFLDPWNTPRNQWDWFGTNFHLYDQKVAANRTVKMIGQLKDRQSWLAKDKAMMIRRTKSEVLTQLPPKQYVDVEVFLSKAQLRDYVEVRAEYMDSPKPEPMVFATRARQMADCQWDKNWEPRVGGESSKLNWLIEWLDSRGYIDNSLEGQVVIVSQFSKVLHWLSKELEKLGVRAEILDGSTPQKQRDEIQRDFQDGDFRIVLLSGQMGVGITLDAADDLIMFDSPYDPDRVEQIEDRVHRASNMHKVTIWNLIAVGTVDQAIAEKVSRRYKVTRRLLDQSRGVEIEREVIARLTKMSDPSDKLDTPEE